MMSACFLSPSISHDYAGEELTRRRSRDWKLQFTLPGLLESMVSLRKISEEYLKLTCHSPGSETAVEQLDEQY